MIRIASVLIVIAALAAISPGAPAGACPGLHAKDKHLFLAASQLQRPKVAEVRAGGTVLLGACETLPGTGNIPFEPSVAIHYVADRKARDLEFRTEGDCDTVLLLRTPSGRWFFDDDNGLRRNARIRLGSPPEGRYEIWVGSNAGRLCNTKLALQSFRARVRLAEATVLHGRI